MNNHYEDLLNSRRLEVSEELVEVVLEFIRHEFEREIPDYTACLEDLHTTLINALKELDGEISKKIEFGHK